MVTLASELCLTVQSHQADVVEPAAGPSLVFWMHNDPLYTQVLGERSAGLLVRQQVCLAVRVLLRVEFSQSHYHPVGYQSHITIMSAVSDYAVFCKSVCG
jgi:hypothetical protein